MVELKIESVWTRGSDVEWAPENTSAIGSRKVSERLSTFYSNRRTISIFLKCFSVNIMVCIVRVITQNSLVLNL